MIKSKSHTVRRVAVSTFDAECLELVESIDAALCLKLLLEEALNGPMPSALLVLQAKAQGTEMPARAQVPVDAFCDGMSVVQNVMKIASTTLNKRRVMDISHLREMLALGVVRSIRHLDGRINPANPLTKRCSPTEKSRLRLLHLMETGICSLIL